MTMRDGRETRLPFHCLQSGGAFSPLIELLASEK